MSNRSAGMVYGRDTVGLVQSGSQEQKLVAPREQAVRGSVIGLQR
jgi:hypothetical protein